MRFRVKIVGRVPFLKPVNLTPIDLRLSADQAGYGLAFMANVGSEKFKGNVKFSIWHLEVSAVIEQA